MGAALAHALMNAGHRITLWNRSREKLAPFLAKGALAPTDLAASIAASPILLTCLSDYQTTRALLGDQTLAASLKGRLLIELTTGKPDDARQAAAWAKSLGLSYLDGAILGGPHLIGGAKTIILLAGAAKDYERCRPLLSALAGDLRHVGENIAAAAALDFAWLCRQYALYIGVSHGAAICQAEGVLLEHYPGVFPQGDPARFIAETIRDGRFANPGATMKVWRHALALIEEAGRAKGMNQVFPSFAAKLIDQAIAAGHGDEHLAALFKLLQDAD